MKANTAHRILTKKTRVKVQPTGVQKVTEQVNVMLCSVMLCAMITVMLQ